MKTKFNAGDLIEVSKGESVSRGRVIEVSGGLALPSLPDLEDRDKATYIDWLDCHGFILNLIEAAPTPLPTEPGVYTTAPKSPEINPLYMLSRTRGWRVYWPNSATIESRSESEMRSGIYPSKLVRLVSEVD